MRGAFLLGWAAVLIIIVTAKAVTMPAKVVLVRGEAQALLIGIGLLGLLLLWLIFDLGRHTDE